MHSLEKHSAGPRPSYYKVRVRVTDFDPRTGEATVECFDLIDALGLARLFYAATAFAYLFRRGRKAGAAVVEDMRKAAVFCEQSAEREHDPHVGTASKLSDLVVAEPRSVDHAAPAPTTFVPTVSPSTMIQEAAALMGVDAPPWQCAKCLQEKRTGEKYPSADGDVCAQCNAKSRRASP